MVKKMKSTAEAATGKAKDAAAGVMDSHLAHAVKESAQQIWLAGMGAFSKAQEEGTKVFETLVKEGMSLQKKTQGIAEDKISEVTGKMSAMAGTVTAKAGQNWDKLELIFEQRTAKAMGKLGVPTAADLEALSQRVDALAAAVAKLSKAAPVKDAAAAPRMPARAAKTLAKTLTKAVAKTAAGGQPVAKAVKAAVKTTGRRASKAI